VEIVIDKSYLQGSSAEVIGGLCETQTVLFTETLFYELLTTDESARKACFAKFPASENPVVLIPHAGQLFRYEIEHRRAASPLIHHRLPWEFRFNAELASGVFYHPPNEEEALAKWRLAVEHEARTFHEVATSVSTWCPGLRTVSGPALRTACEELKQQACTDANVVRRVYGSLGLDDFPSASSLDPSWALFRWVQAHLLFSLDHISRYGFADLGHTPERVEHDFHDIQYVIFGSLCGAIATRDKAIASNFSLACPTGTCLR